MTDPYHSGERAVQEMTGERNAAMRNARVIGDTVPAGAIRFIAQQHMCVLGWASEQGDIWAGVITGSRGFARTDDEGKMLFVRLEGDSNMLFRSLPLAKLRKGDPLGLLFIDLLTRRRLRANGQVTEISETELAMAIEQAYPNCQKYIQRRTTVERTRTTDSTKIEAGDVLTDNLRAWIMNADTFFVASAHPNGPLDASHRGGSPGFVRLQNDVLRIPDYPGNSIFNTLGNLHLNPHAGLAFVDFDNNRQLKMTGKVHLDLNAREDVSETGGTSRWWEFHPEQWIVAPLNRDFGWKFIEASPFNVRTLR